MQTVTIQPVGNNVATLRIRRTASPINPDLIFGKDNG
jgi:hypothetical protein